MALPFTGLGIGPIIALIVYLFDPKTSAVENL